MSKKGNRLRAALVSVLLLAGTLGVDAGSGAYSPTDRSPNAELGRSIARQGNAALWEIRAEARRSALAFRPAPLVELARPGTLIARAER